MGQFKMKPVVIEAIRCRDAHHLMGTNWSALPKWFQNAYEGRNKAGVKAVLSVKAHLFGIDIVTLEGILRVNIDDWIICNVKGEIYPCKPEIFEATYEPLL